MSDQLNYLNMLRQKLVVLDQQRAELIEEIQSLLCETGVAECSGANVTLHSAEPEKIRLFRSLFSGCDDVFPRRFESRKSGRSGYQPACKNEWRTGVCFKPKVKCAACEHREFVPVAGQNM